jgi:hypothetical protein
LEGTGSADLRFTRMIEVYRYQILDADGNLREMPDMITLSRVAELNAIVIVGSEMKVPQIEVSAVGHFTPIPVA